MAASIAAAFEKLCGLLRYVDGDYSDPATFQPCFARNWVPRNGRRTTSPFRRCCSGQSSEQLAEAELRTRGARVIVEKPFGHDLASAQELNRILLETFRRSRHLPHRPLPRQAAGAQHGVLPLRQRFLERSGTATTSRACRSRWRRISACRAAEHFTIRPAPSATWSRITCSRCLANLAMEPPVAHRQRIDPRRESESAQGDSAD